MTSQIPLFTSIPPKSSRPANGRNFGDAWQKLCVTSWNASGFRPISLNTPAEIESLRTLPIEFQSIQRPRPLIADFLVAAKNSGGRVAGIVNADCMTIPHLGLSTAIENLLENGVVIVERLNISQQELRPTGQHCFGFDGFFFTIDSLEKIEWSEDWTIGSVWWDYCFPLAFHSASQRIRTLPSPGLVHLDHDKRWTMAQWRSDMPKLISAMQSHAEFHERVKPYLNAVPERDEDFRSLVEAAFAWLRSREKLYEPPFESIEELLTVSLAAMAIAPHQHLGLKQLCRLLPGAAMRATRRIFRSTISGRPTSGSCSR